MAQPDCGGLSTTSQSFAFVYTRYQGKLAELSGVIVDRSRGTECLVVSIHVADVYYDVGTKSFCDLVA